MALNQGSFSIIEGAFVGAVFDFNAHRALIACVAEDREELAPLNIAESWEFGEMVEVWMGEDSVLIDEVLIQADVFGVDVKDSIDELADGLEVVHVLEDQVGGIVVEPEIGAC